MNNIRKLTVKIILPFTLLLLTACGGGSSTTTSTPAPIPPPVIEKMNYQEEIENAISVNLPGIILLVESPDDNFLGATGVADIDTVESIQTYHTVPSASAGKPMISLLVAMLHEEGFLDMDQTIDTWLSDELVQQIPNGDQITLRQLLNHTSGIYNYTEDSDFFEAVLNDPSSLRTDIDIIPFGLNHSAYFLPGAGFEYSNTGYLLVGIILDNLLGEHHSIELRNRVFTPLGMTSSFYKGIEKDRGDFIAGYDDIEGAGSLTNIKPYQVNIARANAPVVSNVEELALFLKSLISDETFINENIRNNLFGNDALIAVDGYFYGLGIHRQTINNKAIYFHNGLEPGYTTYNIYIPETNTSIAAHFNCGGYEQCENESNALIQKVLNNELY